MANACQCNWCTIDWCETWCAGWSHLDLIQRWPLRSEGINSDSRNIVKDGKNNICKLYMLVIKSPVSRYWLAVVLDYICLRRSVCDPIVSTLTFDIIIGAWNGYASSLEHLPHSRLYQPSDQISGPNVPEFATWTRVDPDICCVIFWGQH